MKKIINNIKKIKKEEKKCEKTAVVFEDRNMTPTEFLEYAYLHIYDSHPSGRSMHSLVPSGVTPKNAQILLKDCESNVEEMHRKYYTVLPSDEAIRKREGIPNGTMPVIYYEFISSTCLFGADCTICHHSINKAYIGVRPDEGKDTFENGLSIEEALERKYATLAAWTDEEWLLCQSCIKRANGRYRIIRPFRFEGDIPYGRSIMLSASSYDRTTEKIFRKTPVKDLEK